MNAIPKYLFKYALKHAPLDVEFIGYLMQIISNIERKKQLPITKTTKYIVNFIRDFQGFDYRPDMIYRANPHGFVCAFSGDGMRNISTRDCYLRDVANMAEHHNLWKYLESGNTVEPLILLEEADREQFPDIEMFFEACSTLIKIYNNLSSTEKLNILASHRTINDDYECLEFEFRYWETNFLKIIEKLKLIVKLGSEVSQEEIINIKTEIIKSEKNMYISCHEIYKKILYSYKGILDVKRDLENLKNNDIRYQNGFPKVFIDNIIKSINPPQHDVRIQMMEKINTIYLTPFYLLLASILRFIKINNNSIITSSWHRNKRFNDVEKKHSTYFDNFNEKWNKYNSAEKLNDPNYYFKLIQNIPETKINIADGMDNQFNDYLTSSNLKGIIELFNNLHSQIIEIGDNKNLLIKFSSIEEKEIEELTKGTEGDI